VAKLNIPKIGRVKVRNGDAPLVMVTAHDAPSARVASAAGADMILVGDSLAMVVLGYDNTLQVTVDDMAYHTAAVARANPDAVIVGDMPWMSFHITPEETVRNAAKLIRAGAEAVKLEGGRKRIPMIKALINAEIPVMGHIGLTPQSTHVFGGFKTQGREDEAARLLVAAAKGLASAKCFSLVLEGVPDVVGNMVTQAVDIPIIGIGAGKDTDGQVLVHHDLIGLENCFKPKFVRRYGTAFDDQVKAISNFADDVRSGNFPGPDETYQAGDGLAGSIGLYGSQSVKDRKPTGK